MYLYIRLLMSQFTREIAMLKYTYDLQTRLEAYITDLYKNSVQNIPKNITYPSICKGVIRLMYDDTVTYKRTYLETFVDWFKSTYELDKDMAVEDLKYLLDWQYKEWRYDDPIDYLISLLFWDVFI